MIPDGCEITELGLGVFEFAMEFNNLVETASWETCDFVFESP